MRVTNSNFNTYLALNNKSPVVSLEFDGKTTIFFSGTFADIGSPPGGTTYKKYIDNLEFEMPDLELVRGDYTPATFVVTLLDKNGEVTDFFSGFNLFQTKVTIKLGFQELNYSDFISLGQGHNYIESVSVRDFHVYELIIKDSFFNLANINIDDLQKSNVNLGGVQMFAVRFDSFLAGDIICFGSDDPSFYYGTQAELLNFAAHDSRVKPCVLIEDEIFSYSGLGTVPNRLTTYANPHGRSPTGAHTNGAFMYAGIGFFTDPMRAFLHFLTTADGTNGEYDLGMQAGGFPNINNHFNLGYLGTHIDESFVDVDGIQKLGWKHFREDEFKYGQFFHFTLNNAVFPQTRNFLNTCLDRFLKPNGFYIYFNAGKIKVGTNDVIDFFENFSSVLTLNEDNIIAIGDMRTADLSDAGVTVREVENNIVHSTMQGDTDFLTSYEYLSVAGGRSEDIGTTLWGGAILTSDDTQIYTNAITTRFLLMSELKTVVDIDASFKTVLLEQGDQVLLTYDKIPNFSTGDRGVTATKGLVIGQRFSLKSNSISHRVALFEIPAYLKNSKSGDVYYVANKIAEGSITDKNLAVSADETATTEAADAYYDNSGTAYEADVVMCRIRITPPAFGAGSDFETISLKFMALSAAPAILYSDYRRYICFNPQSSTAFTVDVYLFSDTANLAPDRIKVDWIATTAAGGEVPTVELIEVWFIEFSI